MMLMSVPRSPDTPVWLSQWSAAISTFTHARYDQVTLLGCCQHGIVLHIHRARQIDRYIGLNPCAPLRAKGDLLACPQLCYGQDIFMAAQSRQIVNGNCATDVWQWIERPIETAKVYYRCSAGGFPDERGFLPALGPIEV
jgi:hypothetical protein